MAPPAQLLTRRLLIRTFVFKIELDFFEFVVHQFIASPPFALHLYSRAAVNVVLDSLSCWSIDRGLLELVCALQFFSLESCCRTS